MNIKNRWTAIIAVKIISFVLIIVSVFGILTGFFNFMRVLTQTNVAPDVMLVDFNSNQYFFNTNINDALTNVTDVLLRGTEDSIIRGNNLHWIRSTETAWSDALQSDVFLMFSELRDKNNWDWYGRMVEYAAVLDSDESWNLFDFWLNREAGNNFSNFDAFYEANSDAFMDLNNIDILTFLLNELYVSPESEDDLMQQAITNQLSAWHSAVSRLRNTPGLNFMISLPNEDVENGITVISNLSPENQNRSFFTNNSLYLISENGQTSSSDEVSISRRSSNFLSFLEHMISTFNEENSTYASNISPSVFISFNDTFVTSRMAFYEDVSAYYMTQVVQILIFAVVGLFSFIVLLVGAGRKTKSDAIHFIPTDKPYLDISLLFVGLWSGFFVYLTFLVQNGLWEQQWGQRNLNAIYATIAAGSIICTAPILLWFSSLAKRIKARKFWKHTLVYAVLTKVFYRFIRFCFKSVHNLWAGAKLTGKVAIITAIFFFILLLTIFFTFATEGFAVLIILLFTAGAAILLQRFAKRIHILEKGAAHTCAGNYDSPIDVGGGELGSIATSINSITHGIQAAVDERMKSEKLKTELITNVSHDIRTPLTSIITYTDLLKHEGLNGEKAPEYLDIVIQKSNRLKSLTDELFEAAKAVTGNIEVNFTDLDICSLLNQVLGENDTTIESSGLNFRKNLPDKLIVRADGKLMWRVIENLLSNAIKYAMPHSRVYIDVSQTNKSYMRLEIKNISKDELNFDPSELTERFKRGDNSRTDGGSGLGLSIAQSFVHAQNGLFNISIDGDLFKVTIELPLGEKQQGVA